MYKSLMLPLGGHDGDADALYLAARLAALHGAHLQVLEMVDLPAPMVHPWGMMPDLATVQSHAQLRERGMERLAALRQRLAAEPIAWDARVAEALHVGAPRVAAREAYDCDLVVLGGAVGDTVEAVSPHEYFAAVLFESGCPVLVVPPRCDPVLPMRRVAIAWQPTRECARAVRDALPLLLAAKAVDVLAIDEGRGIDAEPSGRRLIAHLRRHGVEAAWVARAAGENTVAGQLLEFARRSGAHLLVAGGYGHSRLREWALGGVTRELLIAADLPVLYAH